MNQRNSLTDYMPIERSIQFEHTYFEQHASFLSVNINLLRTTLSSISLQLHESVLITEGHDVMLKTFSVILTIVLGSFIARQIFIDNI